MVWNKKMVLEALNLSTESMLKEFAAYGASIDSRTIRQNDIFIGINGANTDGSIFANDAIKSGACCAIIGTNAPTTEFEDRCIRVDDCILALINMAKYKRDIMHDCKFVGITGSVGKTTLKEMLRFVLRDQDQTFCSSGNFNNHYGLPLSIIQMPIDTRYGIFEMGMSAEKEIQKLSDILRPHIAIITCVGAAHLASFSSISAIACAKSEIFSGMQDYDIAILNIDDTYVEISRQIAKEKKLKIIHFGKDNKADFKLIDHHCDDKNSYIKMQYNNRLVEYSISAPEEHFAHLSLAALAICHALGAEVAFGARALSKFTPLTGRGKMHSSTWQDKKIRIIDDTYNASPKSVKAAIESLKNKVAKRKIIVLGDMKELGPQAKLMHQEIAKHIIENNISHLYTVGEMTKHLCKSLDKKIDCALNFKNNSELISELKNNISNDDILLIKASNSMKFHEIVDYFLGNNEKPKLT